MNSQNLFSRIIGIKKRIIRGEKCLELLERKYGKVETVIRGRQTGTDKRYVILIMKKGKSILVNIYNFNTYEDVISSR